VTAITSAYGQTYASTESTTYTANGKVASVTDGNGNKTTYIYDGFDRLSKTEYPNPTSAGTSSTTDYEQLGYDANGNVISRRLRDGTSIGYTYDHLNRLTNKNLPGSEPDVTYGYDLLGRLKSATQTGNSLSFTYDALGRVLTQHGPEGTLTSTWDPAGRRTKLQWPDGFYVNYDYDVLDEMTKVRENGATSGVGVLASYTYDDLGNRVHASYGNGTASAWTPDAASRLHQLVHNLAGSSYDLTRTFTYNPAQQIASMTSSNTAYAWNAAANVNRSYTVNGRNQYTASGGTSLGYDTRGNLTSSGANGYTYTSENLMKTGPGSTSLTYDPLLQLYQVTKGSATTRFAYDGQEMVAEYNGSNALQHRYVFGAGTDDPIVQYDGTGTSSRNWLVADERGSIIALTNSSGSVTHVNSYDEYGIPGTGNTGRFQYTGQEWMPEIGLYYYKARMYSPSLGRFMQTDPIGYKDGLNWYNYVGADPINLTDFNGNEGNGTIMVISPISSGLSSLSSAPGLGAAMGFSGVSTNLYVGQSQAQPRGKNNNDDTLTEEEATKRLLRRLSELRKKIQACAGAASSNTCAPLWKEYEALLNSPRGRLLRAADVNRHTRYLRWGLDLLGGGMLPVAKGATGSVRGLLAALGAAAVADAIDHGIDLVLSGGEDPVGDGK
jgi:RHS repeat-associated protein